jgi:MFS family permease
MSVTGSWLLRLKGISTSRTLTWRGPLAGSYYAAVGMVLCALTPFLVLSAATPPLAHLIGPDVHLGGAGMEMSSGMADAAYCFGTVLAVQLTAKLPGRRLLVGYAGLFVIASIMAAGATSPVEFFAGRILQGLATSLMLITAAPALVLGWPVARMRSTAMVMNMGIFGAVALGPVIGGAFVGLADWRLLFWISAAVGALALLLALQTFVDVRPMDPALEFDAESLALASIGCGAAFFGASGLVDHALSAPIVIVPIIVGAACLVGLIVHQTFVQDPLMPIRQLAHTIPLAAIALALFAGGASVSLVGLLQLSSEARHLSTALFWPEFAGAVITAFLFGRVFFTAYVPVLAFAGMLCLAATALVVAVAGTGSTLVAVGAAGVGLGVGASVAPGLFVAGFSLPSRQLPRIFALVELLRGVAAFLTAPIILYVARTTGADLDAGITTATWTTFGLLVVGAAVVAGIVASGGLRLQTPRIAEWQEGEVPAIDSAPFAAALRRRHRQTETCDDCS